MHRKLSSEYISILTGNNINRCHPPFIIAIYTGKLIDASKNSPELALRLRQVLNAERSNANGFRGWPERPNNHDDPLADAFTASVLNVPVESNHLPSAPLRLSLARPRDGVRGRTARGSGHDAQSVRYLLELPENQDVQAYHRASNPYARDLSALIGAFKFSSLLAKVKQLDGAAHIKYPRNFKRSEPLMVKWLYQRRDILSNLTPAPDAVHALPELPQEEDFFRLDWFDGMNQDPWYPE
jgi:hypothetical protein